LIFDIGSISLVIQNATETGLINYFVDCSKSVCDLTTISGLIIGGGIGAVVASYVYYISTKTSKQRRILVYHSIMWSLLSLRASTKRLQKTVQQFKERYNKEAKIEDLESETNEIKHASEELAKEIANSRYDLSGDLISKLNVLYAEANLLSVVDPQRSHNSQFVIDQVSDFLNGDFKKYYNFLDYEDMEVFKIFERTRFDYEDESKRKQKIDSPED